MRALLDTLQFAGHLVWLQGGDDVCPGHGRCCHCPRGEDQEAGGHEAALHAAAAAAVLAGPVSWRDCGDQWRCGAGLGQVHWCYADTDQVMWRDGDSRAFTSLLHSWWYTYLKHEPSTKIKIWRCLHLFYCILCHFVQS